MDWKALNNLQHCYQSSVGCRVIRNNFIFDDLGYPHIHELVDYLLFFNSEGDLTITEITVYLYNSESPHSVFVKHVYYTSNVRGQQDCDFSILANLGRFEHVSNNFACPKEFWEGSHVWRSRKMVSLDFRFLFLFLLFLPSPVLTCFFFWRSSCPGSHLRKAQDDGNRHVHGAVEQRH